MSVDTRGKKTFIYGGYMNIINSYKFLLSFILVFLMSCSCDKSPTGPNNHYDPRNISRNEGKSIQPSLAIDSNSSIHLVWADSTSGNFEILYSTNSDKVDWSVPANISITNGKSLGPKIAIDPYDNLQVVWEERDEHSTEIFYSNKINGSQWSTPTKISNSGRAPDLGTDENGNIHVTWILPNSYRMRTAAGSWGPIESIPQYYCFNVALAVSQDGEVHIVGDQTIGPWNNVFYIVKPLGGVWSERVNLSDNSMYSWAADIAVDEVGKIYVSWSEIETGRLYFRCKNDNGIWSKRDSVPVTEGYPWGSIVFPARESVHFVFEAGTYEEDYDIYYIAKYDTLWSTILNISESPGYGSLGPSIGLSNGYLHIAWQEETSSGWDIFYTTIQTK